MIGLRAIAQPPNRERNSNFKKIKQLIDDALIFNHILKGKFKNKETYEKNREKHKKLIRRYSSFSQGKYVVIAIIRLILMECGYTETLLNKTQLFQNKDFIKSNLLNNWLPTILSKLLIPEYEKATEQGMSLNTFYLRTKTFENISETFELLDEKEVKEYTDIFPFSIIEQNNI